MGPCWTGRYSNDLWLAKPYVKKKKKSHRLVVPRLMPGVSSSVLLLPVLFFVSASGDIVCVPHSTWLISLWPQGKKSRSFPSIPLPTRGSRCTGDWTAPRISTYRWARFFFIFACKCISFKNILNLVWHIALRWCLLLCSLVPKSMDLL